MGVIFADAAPVSYYVMHTAVRAVIIGVIIVAAVLLFKKLRK